MGSTRHLAFALQNQLVGIATHQRVEGHDQLLAHAASVDPGCPVMPSQASKWYCARTGQEHDQTTLNRDHDRFILVDGPEARQQHAGYCTPCDFHSIGSIVTWQLQTLMIGATKFMPCIC